MTKADLIDEVSKISSLTKKETETIVNTIFDNITDALSKADGRAKAAVDQLETLAGQMDAEAAKASGIDQKRYKALAETLRGRAAKLR